MKKVYDVWSVTIHRKEVIVLKEKKHTHTETKEHHKNQD